MSSRREGWPTPSEATPPIPATRSHRPPRSRARLLANDARQALHAAGLSDADIDRLANDFISEDRGEATEPFIDWATRVRQAARG